ncbi:MAG: PDZ domain-containing protein, partial [Flavobacteriales bacterium]|nr:PDZ domain-containing protein [Flavobacteriales bacterium]
MNRLWQASIVLLAVLVSGTIVGQKKATLEITKRQNGRTETIVEEIEIEEGQDVDQIFKEMGLLDDLNDLSEGQTLEINIRKSDDFDSDNYDISFFDVRESRGFLGVTLENQYDENGEWEAVRINSIIENTAAEEYDLRSGDIVLSVGDIDKPDLEQFVEAIRMHQPGDLVRISVLRGKQVIQMNIELGERESNGMNFEDWDFGDQGLDFNWDENTFEFSEPFEHFEFEGEGFRPEEQPFFGVSPSWEQGDKGVRIGEITDGSAAEDMGLEEGDVILEFDKIEVNNFDELAYEIRNHQPGDEVSVKILRDSRKKTLKGEVGSRACHDMGEINIFPDFKGMDEDGAMLFDFHFDLDDAGFPFSQEEFEDFFQNLPQEVIPEDFEIPNLG